MAISYTTAMRDQVCLALLGKTYANCLTHEQTLLDGATSSGSLPIAEPTTGLPTSIARDAFIALTQYIQWFGEAGSLAANAASAFEPVVKSEMVARLAQALRPQEYGMHVATARAALQQAVDSYSIDDFSDTSQVFGVGALSVQRIRKHVIQHCVRRKPRLMVPVANIDMAYKWAVNHLTQRGAWLFRTRDLTMTVTTASDGSAPSFSGLVSGESFDGLLSTRLFYTDSTQTYTADPVLWASPDAWAEGRAAWGTTTGRPVMFRIEQRGSTLYWQWLPRPDRTYTLQGLALISTPALASAATDTTIVAKFPAEFESIFPELVLARVLRSHGASGWEAVWSRVDAEIANWAQQYQRTGLDFYGLAPTDAYQDYRFQTPGGL